jgi:ketosteroid isomerase-like protein
MSELIEVSKNHFLAVQDKRIDDIIDFYADSPELLVFVEGPRWATLSFERVSKGWRDFVDTSIFVKSCEWVENLESKVVGEMGFVGGIVEMKVDINGELKTIRFRGTFVFQLEADGKWRVIHEHFSQPAADPYGIGDWLKKD